MSRKLDAAIAEALGGVIVDISEVYPFSSYPFSNVGGMTKHVVNQDGKVKQIPHYSTDGNAMLELDREMRERGWCVVVERINEVWSVVYWKAEQTMAIQCTEEISLPKPVALAAYKALTGKVLNEVIK